MKNPFTEALYYEGDFLKSLLLVEKSYWESHEYFRSEVLKIIDKARSELSEIDTTEDIRSELLEAFQSFKE